jgi:hypothetical protein
MEKVNLMTRLASNTFELEWPPQRGMIERQCETAAAVSPGSSEQMGDVVHYSAKSVKPFRTPLLIGIDPDQAGVAGLDSWRSLDPRSTRFR